MSTQTTEQSTVKVESKEDIKARLKKEHSDWDENKLNMQAGRIRKQQEKEKEKADKRNAVKAEILQKEPNLEGKELESKIDVEIKKQEDDAKEETLVKQVSETAKAHDKAVADLAVFRESRKGGNSSKLPKDVTDAIKKLQKANL